MEEVLQFAGVTAVWDSDVLDRRFNVSSAKKRRSAVERGLAERTESRLLRGALRRVARPFRRSFERPVLSTRDREKLSSAIAPDVEALREFSGLSLSDWSL